MIWLGLAAIAVAVLVVRWAIVRAFASAKPIGAPTPQDVAIRKEADDIAARVQSQAEKDKQEVQNASGAQLYDLARRRLRKPD